MISKIQGFFITNKHSAEQYWKPVRFFYKHHKITMKFHDITLNALDNFKCNKYHCY